MRSGEERRGEELHLVEAADVHGEDVLGAALLHDVGRQVVRVAAVQQQVAVLHKYVSKQIQKIFK